MLGEEAIAMHDELEFVVSPFVHICHTDEQGEYWTTLELRYVE